MEAGTRQQLVALLCFTFMISLLIVFGIVLALVGQQIAGIVTAVGGVVTAAAAYKWGFDRVHREMEGKRREAEQRQLPRSPSP